MDAQTFIKDAIEKAKQPLFELGDLSITNAAGEAVKEAMGFNTAMVWKMRGKEFNKETHMQFVKDLAKGCANFTYDCIERHLSGDWGDLDEGDRHANEDALQNGGRLFSSYFLPCINPDAEVKLWIITEADRSATTILLPSDY